MKKFRSRAGDAPSLYRRYVIEALFSKDPLNIIIIVGSAELPPLQLRHYTMKVVQPVLFPARIAFQHSKYGKQSGICNVEYLCYTAQE